MTLDDLNRIYNMDCIEGMKMLADNSIDCIIADPPYNVTEAEWDKAIPMDELWSQLKRIRKPSAPILLFGIEPFSTKVRMSNLSEYRYDLIWEKSRPTGFIHAKNMPLRKHENISVFCQYGIGHASRMNGKRMPYYPQGIKPRAKAYKNNDRKSNVILAMRGERKQEYQGYTNYPSSILRFRSEGKCLHPTQKPLSLIEYLIKTYTREGDCVLDFCMGSGTTAIACQKTGRNYIGFESNEEIYKKAEKRIKENDKQY